MAPEPIRVKAKPISARRKKAARSNKKFYIYAGLTIFALLLVIGLTVSFFFGKTVFAAQSTIFANGNRQIIRVPKGGDLQAAINKAKSGDIVELQAGATYYGEIKLPNKSITDFITIQSSAAGQLPENVRVKPSNAVLMAKIVTKGDDEPAVTTENGAHHFRFVGIEFTPDNDEYVYNIIYFGTPEDKTDIPHDLEIDRCYLHPNKAGKTRRGLAINSAATIVKNSYFEGFAYSGEETQAIAGWTATKNVKIINNHLEGGAENVLFGGADPASSELIPSDIEVRGNYFYKPVAWKGATMKNLFELKNAKRVQFTDNYLENSWTGSALTITVRNQDGKAPFSTIEDVLIKNNVIINVGEGINILGTDNVYPSQTLKGLNIINNLFLDIGNRSFSGSGYFVQINGGENVLIANNTVFNSGNLTTLYGDVPKNFLFRDNIVGHSDYGIHGHRDIKSAQAQQMFQNNVIVDNKRIDPSGFSYPSGNFVIRDYNAAGFINAAQNDFRLAQTSRLKGRGRDKTDVGANINVADFLKIKD